MQHRYEPPHPVRLIALTVLGCAALVALLVSIPAEAAEPTDMPPNPSASSAAGPATGQHEARRRTFEQGLDAIRAEHWQQARDLFFELWKDKQTYDVSLNLGLAEYNLGRYREAAQYVAYGLDNLPPREKTEMATRAEQVLGLCEERLGTVELIVANQETEVAVDGQVVPAWARVAGVFVLPGPHRFEVRLAGFETERFTLTLRQAERQSRSVTLLPGRAVVDPVSDSAPASSGSDPVAPKRSSGRPWYRGWTPMVATGAVTLLATGVGIALGVARGREADKAADLRRKVGDNGCAGAAAARRECASLLEANQLYDDYGFYELTSFVVAGLALAGSTTYFFIARPDRKADASARSGPSLRWGARASTRGAELILENDFW
ncbi:MAG: hypothetical protein JW940_39590 [Polyangiaceae bacterium]|nr:hypothetical protein [Polyangiaceae bacterium]